MTGGRSDITYSVVCEHCDGALCVPCGEAVRFKPGAAGLEDTAVTASGLQPHPHHTQASLEQPWLLLHVAHGRGVWGLYRQLRTNKCEEASPPDATK